MGVDLDAGEGSIRLGVMLDGHACEPRRRE
jgi:hypothetical protein